MGELCCPEPRSQFLLSLCFEQGLGSQPGPGSPRRPLGRACPVSTPSQPLAPADLSMWLQSFPPLAGWDGVGCAE